MTPLDRLLFQQGQRCFFCNRTIPKNEASVDHLVPVSAGGTDRRDNLVACCKALNQMFGDMTVKEKLRVVLNQNGKFTCPQVRAENRIQPLPSSVPVSKAA